MNPRHLLSSPADTEASFGLDLLLNRGLHDEQAHIRAYERWSDMLRGRACPSIEDLDGKDVAGPCDILLDLRWGGEDPQLVCVGGALLADCGKRGMKRVSEVPTGSFLALLTAHHPQAARSRLPIAFDGERRRDEVAIGYRGILLPLSSDGEEVDFIYGTISWREPASPALASQIQRQAAQAATVRAAAPASPLWPAA